MARRTNYPHRADIKRLIAAARDSGIDPAGIEMSPDGTIRIIEARATSAPADEFSKWESRL